MRRLSILFAGLTGMGFSVMTMAQEAAEGGHEKPPELISFQPETAIWVLVIFIVMLVVLYPTAWKGVLAGLKAREERIRKEIADAEADRAKAQATLAEYNKQLATAEEKVRELLAKAVADGERIAANIRTSAATEAGAIKDKALSDIEDARKVAVTQIQAQAAEMATAIAEKIIRRNLNVDDQRELVRASLEQLEATRRN